MTDLDWTPQGDFLRRPFYGVRIVPDFMGRTVILICDRNK